MSIAYDCSILTLWFNYDPIDDRLGLGLGLRGPGAWESRSRCRQRASALELGRQVGSSDFTSHKLLAMYKGAPRFLLYLVFFGVSFSFCASEVTPDTFPTGSWAAAALSSYEQGPDLFSLPFQNLRSMEMIAMTSSVLPLLL